MHRQRKVKEVRELEDGVEILFEDGEIVKGDVVICADGVKGVVCKALYGNHFPAVYTCVYLFLCFEYLFIAGLLVSAAFSTYSSSLRAFKTGLMSIQST